MAASTDSRKACKPCCLSKSAQATLGRDCDGRAPPTMRDSRRSGFCTARSNPIRPAHRVTPEVCAVHGERIEHGENIMYSVVWRVRLCRVRFVTFALAARIQHDQAIIVLKSVECTQCRTSREP